MSKLFSIALVTWRQAVRSGLLAAGLGLLLLTAWGLPAVLHGDGTPAGRLEVVLRYTLGIGAALLAAAALWTATLSLASEMADRTLDLVRTHPIHPAAIWGGKFLGLLAVCAVWVVTLGLLVAVEAHGIAASALPPSTFHPPPPTSHLPPTTYHLLSSRRLLEPVACDAAAEDGTVVAAPGRAVSWSFTLPADTPTNRPLAVSCRYVSSRPGAFTVHGVWSLHPARNAPACATGATDSVSGRALETPLAGPCPAARDVTLRFTHNGGGLDATLAFAPGNVHLVLLEPGPAANLARGLTLLLARLAVIVALGLSMGALLSPPVAIFSGAALLVILGMTDSIHTVARSGVFFVPHESPLVAPDLFDHLALGVYRLVDLLLTPLRALDPMPALGNRAWISSGAVALGLSLAVLCVTILALPGIAALRRRQLALIGE